MHWFEHFLTKLSKYLWIKTGDRHYHFVEPWVIDRPFCRMEIVYQSHFVETGVGSLQNGAPQPPPREWQGGSICEVNVGTYSIHGAYGDGMPSPAVPGVPVAVPGDPVSPGSHFPTRPAAVGRIGKRRNDSHVAGRNWNWFGCWKIAGWLRRE